MTTPTALQEQMIALVRAFGLHQPEQTPCGQPVNVAEAYTLMELIRDGMLPQHELVERLNLAKSTVSRLVNGLVRRGWVERMRNPQDKRSRLLALTQDGQNIAATIAAARQQKFTQVLERIPTDQHASVIQSLHILVEAIRESNRESITRETV